MLLLALLLIGTASSSFQLHFKYGVALRPAECANRPCCWTGCDASYHSCQTRLHADNMLFYSPKSTGCSRTWGSSQTNKYCCSTLPAGYIADIKSIGVCTGSSGYRDGGRPGSALACFRKAMEHWEEGIRYVAYCSSMGCGASMNHCAMYTSCDSTLSTGQWANWLLYKTNDGCLQRKDFGASAVHLGGGYYQTREVCTDSELGENGLRELSAGKIVMKGAAGACTGATGYRDAGFVSSAMDCFRKAQMEHRFGVRYVAYCGATGCGGSKGHCALYTTCPAKITSGVFLHYTTYQTNDNCLPVGGPQYNCQDSGVTADGSSSAAGRVVTSVGAGVCLGSSGYRSGGYLGSDTQCFEAARAQWSSGIRYVAYCASSACGSSLHHCALYTSCASQSTSGVYAHYKLYRTNDDCLGGTSNCNGVVQQRQSTTLGNVLLDLWDLIELGHM